VYNVALAKEIAVTFHAKADCSFTTFPTFTTKINETSPNHVGKEGYAEARPQYAPYLYLMMIKS
jgi:hypothetical protein